MTEDEKAARADYRWERDYVAIREHAKTVAAQAPPLTPEQAVKIARLLRLR